MGRGKDSSSESEEDSNVRHDRFKPERFKDSHSNSQSSSSSRSKDFNYDRNNSKRHRERSPHRSHFQKDYSSQRKESRNKYDDIRSNSKSNISYKHDSRKKQSPSQHERKHSRSHNREKDNSSSKTSGSSLKKLSSILKNFDQKMESKRLDGQSHSEIGPALPPNLSEKAKEEKEPSSLDPISSKTNIGPALPPHLKIDNTDIDEDSDTGSVGSQPNKLTQTNVSDTSSSVKPAIPPNPETKNVEEPESLEQLQNHSVSEMNLSPHSSDSHDNLETFGPVLPPKVEEESYGPALPPNLKKTTVQGPMLPSGITSDDLEKMEQEESDNEDTFGPLPVGKMNMTQYQLELRAMDIKRKLEEEKSGSSKDVNKREEWMLELPPEKASNLGLGPRQFRMKEGPDMSNRSAWTDTPAEKKRKEEMALKGEAEPVNTEEIMRTAFVRERNETMEKISKLSKEEDREKSLLELHQKKLKKKKKKEEKDGKKKERRPFDRNIDLQVHRFDEAQKKAIFKKAQLLDTRFSTGESKFL
ncbi:GPALPP motifs-containing protein 1-like [Macrosteles quadrilineatus]|uniref:GPALPP motifs-containing protein 1-like n=1 Tax=Macrosteles quadrilineatus TaxID=74068 RepID=UPI0023E28D30|nr:GPALPP motifs-containing protein 1-like [Macrosteles quadrilineatus]